MSEEELKEKFRLNASSMLPTSLKWRERIQYAIETCLSLEKLGNVNDLTKLMVTP
ncbi:hypothetical protein ACFLVN_05820 [Chloroflexota bacterium]